MNLCHVSLCAHAIKLADSDLHRAGKRVYVKPDCRIERGPSNWLTQATRRMVSSPHKPGSAEVRRSLPTRGSKPSSPNWLTHRLSDSDLSVRARPERPRPPLGRDGRRLNMNSAHFHVSLKARTRPFPPGRREFAPGL
jgi:hypothetical protein